jgi:hypothetical protein
MCLATVGGNVLWGCTECEPEVHWLTDYKVKPGSGHGCAAHKKVNVTGTATERQCGETIPNVADDSENAPYVGSHTIASYRV